MTAEISAMLDDKLLILDIKGHQEVKGAKRIPVKASALWCLRRNKNAFLHDDAGFTCVKNRRSSHCDPG